MALTTRALTTVATAELFVARAGTQGSAIQEAGDDDYLELLINAYSDAIHRYCGREFKPQTNAATRLFRYDGSGYLSLSPFEIRTVTSVTLYADLPISSQRLLTAASASVEAEYRFEPRQRSVLGTYLWLVLPTVNVNRSYGTEVAIVGDWGAATLPAEIELACLIAVRDAYPLGTVQTTAFGEEPELSFAVASLPLAARALLKPYVR